ncbi:MAG: O-methyltransferase [Phycisphaerales bacterium]
MTPRTAPILDRSDAVDRYLSGLFACADTDPAFVLEEAGAAGLPAIHVSPMQGRSLAVLASIVGARRVLEIGTLAGYSTIWLARALPAGGHVITLEIDARHAQIARHNFQRLGLADRIQLRLGPAIDSLAELHREAADLFDLVFIDADKENTPAYVASSLGLVRPGGVVVIDNAIRRGDIIDEQSTEPGVIGLRRALRELASHPGVRLSVLQTVGSKGYDGFAIAHVVDPSAGITGSP